jgi:hypothetical protein
MASSVVAISGQFELSLPTWGRSFWQDPNDGELFLAFVSGNTQGAFVTSSDSGVTWSNPQAAFPVEDFSTHNNFDTEMDEDGNVHCVYRFNTSGCYTVLGKDVGGGWGISGVAVRNFVDVADTDIAKGFNGMVAVYDTFTSDPFWWGGAFGTRKSANIVVVDSSQDVVHYRVPDSGLFSNFPIAVFEFNGITRTAAGPSGGFPVFTDAGGTEFVRGPTIAWSANATGLAYAGRESSSSVYSFINLFPIDGAEVTPGSPVTTSIASGYLGRVPFNPNMSFDRAVSSRVHPIIASIDNGKFFVGWDLYTTAFEKDIQWAPSNNVFVRAANSLARTTTSPTIDTTRVKGIDTIGTIPWVRAITQGAIPVPVKSIDSLFVAGTANDISHGDSAGVHKIYFQTTDPAGQQVISRILCETSSEETNDEQTRYFFSELFHPSSGIRSFAPAGEEFTGGSGLFLNWKGFKALKHPTLPGVGVPKQEIVVTAGQSINPSNRLIVWDFNKSVEVTQPLKVATFSREITKDSGIAPSFQLISVFGPTYTADKVAQLFDADTTTNVSSLTGDGFILEFDQNVAFTRVEFVRNFSSDYTVKVSGSLDNVTYFPSTELVGGNLMKHSSEYDVLGDTTVDKYIDPFIAKYLKIEVEHAGSRSISELRLYGYHTTAGKTVTGPGRGDISFQLPPGIPTVERFESLRDGQLPVGWRTSGDWDWGAQASGVFAKANGLPTTPPGNGKVKVGQYIGDSIGNGDGFSMRTLTGMPNNSSGILEVDISIRDDELTENDTSGRTIKFDVRFFLSAVGTISGPEDDRFRFFVVPEFGGPFDGELDYNNQGTFIHTTDWLTITTDVAPGNYTLKWVFQRAQEPIVSPWPDEESVAWIDNVVGLDVGEFRGGPPALSIHGVLYSQNVIFESINAYMENPPNASIFAYMSGANPFEPIHGYMQGRPDAFDSINGYLLGMKQGQINALMLGGDGLRSFPTGTIHGLLPTNSGVTTQVNSYLLGMKQGQINALMFGGGSESGQINSYLNADYHFSSILARFGPSGDLITERVLGYMPARAFESINAYMNNAGATTQIFGFMPDQKSALINAFLLGPTASGNAQINAFMGATGVIAPVINAFMSGLSIFEPINGYMINDGIVTNINGYMNVREDRQINGFVHGRDLTNTQVNAYMSGLGFANTQVNAYMFGVSGIINENINGFMIGDQVSTEVINSYLIGWEDACVSHGTIPLPSVPVVVIPSSCFNFGV